MKFLQKLLAKWLFRSHANKDVAAITLPGKLNRIKKVLIVLPEDETAAPAALDVIGFFEKKHKEITLLYHSKISQVCSRGGYTAGGSVSVVEYFDSDKNKLKLPNRALREKLKRKEADLVLDLSGGDDLFGPVSARMVTARYYAGTVTPETEGYYTLQLSRLQPESVDRYLQSLSMVFTQ